MIVILEGVDGSGKSTLAKWLETEVGVRGGFTRVSTIHHGPYPGLKNPSIKYLSSMRRRQHGNTVNELIILDRSWLSEPIYGMALRGGVDRVGVSSRRMLERIAMKAGTFVVVCRPTYDTAAANWAKNKGKELIELPSHFKQVYGLYNVLEHHTDLDCLYFDYELNKIDKHVLADRINSMVKYRPPSPGIGNWGEDSTLIVCDYRDSDGMLDLPYVNFDKDSVSAWFTLELERLGVNEDKLYWVNSSKLAPDFMGRSDAPRNVVALGNDAARWCNSAGLAFNYVPRHSTPLPEVFNK
jgi:hypothetical protein